MIRNIVITTLLLMAVSNTAWGQNRLVNATIAPDGMINLSETENSFTVTLTFSEAFTQISDGAELGILLRDGTRLNFQHTPPRVQSADNGSTTVIFTGTISNWPELYEGSLVFQPNFQIADGNFGSERNRVFTSSAPVQVAVDRVPPRVSFVEIVDSQAVRITFDEPHLNDSYPTGHFVVQANGSDVPLATTDAELGMNNRQITIPLQNPVAGLIRVQIRPVPATTNNQVVPFTDTFGNTLTGYTTTVVATPRSPSGQAVDYPPFVVPSKSPNHTNNDDLRPSGRVVSRVLRLYYYRDAHRVAEIINRRVQKLNIVNVESRRTSADQLRQQAEQATVDRRRAQRIAEQTARETRRKEREVEQKRAEADEASETLAQLRAFPGDYIVVPNPNDPRSFVVVPQTSVDGSDASFVTVETLRTKLSNSVTSFETLSRELDAARINEESANNRARELEDDESRLIKDQFLSEIRAAQEDPNTYARGNIDSPDPVTQTSVSVIGEGLLQLRGPISGINQIRRMVHQIDRPVGQVKVDIQTVQINGEKGDELEETIQLTEGYINIGRFLTNQSLVFLRRSVAEVAAEVASEHGQPWQRTQQGRDLRYLYGFFGQDFIDTLYRMDSEFLHTENQILSLHSMDSISRNRALLLLGLSRNSVRQRILEKFEGYISSELPELEYKYRLTNDAIPCECLPECNCKAKLHKLLTKHHCDCPLYTIENAINNAHQNYNFLNFKNFFGQGGWTDATLNPIQREFIRLAQIFKSQLIAEIELKQRIVERGLMNQTITADEQRRQELILDSRRTAIERQKELRQAQLDTTKTLSATVVAVFAHIRLTEEKIKNAINESGKLDWLMSETKPLNDDDDIREDLQISFLNSPKRIRNAVNTAKLYLLNDNEIQEAYAKLIKESDNLIQELSIKSGMKAGAIRSAIIASNEHGDEVDLLIPQIQALNTEKLAYIRKQYEQLLAISGDEPEVWREALETLSAIGGVIPQAANAWRNAHQRAQETILELLAAEYSIKNIDNFLRNNRPRLPQIKLLDHLIDEHEERAMDLLEGRRAHVSAIDNFLKRMTFALEDDFQVQFYDPALVCIRTAARGRNVSLSQVERTTVLGNNRELLKVRPEATMEFNLPKRQLRVTEAMQGAKALVDDYGALLNDPTFLAAFQLMGGSPPPETLRNVLPGLESDSNQEFFALPGSNGGRPLGGSLQSLVPDPAIYQLETGTGFEVRPVIQPDGDSLVYDFTYLYTTDIREPVRADEKHLGRVKRHFLHTQVQTSSFELREVGRYQVALKVARTGKGVPLLEKTPLVGGLFRPAPSEESSIQQNIVLGKSVVYPTLFDLMGLEWAQHVSELDYDQIRDAGHVARGRQTVIEQHVFDRTSGNVDDFLRIDQDDAQYRPDLYRQHNVPSPYHPKGYVYPRIRDDQDPTRRGFRIQENRPWQYKQGDGTLQPAPEYDDRFRRPSSEPDAIVPYSNPHPYSQTHTSPGHFSGSSGVEANFADPSPVTGEPIFQGEPIIQGEAAPSTPPQPHSSRRRWHRSFH